MIRLCLSLLALSAVAIAGPRQPSPPALTYLFTANITSGPTISLGSTPLGDRVFEPIIGGSFTGPKLSGTVASGGGDAGLVDANGAFNPDVVYVLQTSDGCNILVREKGHAPNLLLLFETGSDKYDWLNSVVAYGKGSQSQSGVSLDVWQVGTSS
ncbi:hypothetical protein J7T55_004801 [Diaporthe amygdali]|uniref:uncharacterized protein n=1 Tax=Phomopsis amygdali TaxID=1214568 RepID=UPI0022FE1AFD|nr:uncharacterized protein J7T55_004801 [Diaporthe amygdali]KAJ0114557.1 hypothetical protein J7T55_004801 [Diaporthe amygdali]